MYRAVDTSMSIPLDLIYMGCLHHFLEASSAYEIMYHSFTSKSFNYIICVTDSKERMNEKTLHFYTCMILGE